MSRVVSPLIACVTAALGNRAHDTADVCVASLTLCSALMYFGQTVQTLWKVREASCLICFKEDCYLI